MRRRPWLPALAVISYAVHLVVIHAMEGLERHQALDLPAISLGALSIGLAQAAVGHTLASQPAAVAVVRALHLLLFWMLCAYLYSSHVPLELSLLAANVEWPLTAGAFEVFVAGVSWSTLVAGGLAVMVTTWRDARTMAIRQPRMAQVAGLASAWVAVALAPFASHDETVRFARSGVDHWRGVSALCQMAAPSVRRSPPGTEDGRLARSPNVVLVMIESLQAAFLDRHDAVGRPIMPVLDGLALRGLFVDRFYAHSVQTAKGHFSVLASIAPAVRGVEFERFPALPVATLPSVLKRAGYRTLFVQGQLDAAFDNTRRFLESHGVDRHAVAAELLSQDERTHLASPWGASDEGTYLAAERLWGEAAGSLRPVLLVIATVGSHQPFTAATAPDSPFPDATSLFERYANAMHSADAALGRFLERLDRDGRLRDTIVVITGDHAFPLGAHGLEHNEAGAYDDFFRVPFVLIDPAEPPRRVSGPYGQIDVSPTILARLGGLAPVSFQGIPILEDRPGRRAGVPLVQPYAGTFVGGVGQRFKYLKHLKTGRERLVDLEIDPSEERNLLPAKAPSSAAARDELRPTAEWLLANHCALENGGVAPPPP